MVLSFLIAENYFLNICLYFSGYVCISLELRISHSLTPMGMNALTWPAQLFRGKSIQRIGDDEGLQ